MNEIYCPVYCYGEELDLFREYNEYVERVRQGFDADPDNREQGMMAEILAICHNNPQEFPLWFKKMRIREPGADKKVQEWANSGKFFVLH